MNKQYYDYGFLFDTYSNESLCLKCKSLNNAIQLEFDFNYPRPNRCVGCDKKINSYDWCDNCLKKFTGPSAYQQNYTVKDHTESVLKKFNSIQTSTGASKLEAALLVIAIQLSEKE
jgi:hypothetical protein